MVLLISQGQIHLHITATGVRDQSIDTHSCDALSTLNVSATSHQKNKKMEPIIINDTDYISGSRQMLCVISDVLHMLELLLTTGQMDEERM